MFAFCFLFLYFLFVSGVLNGPNYILTRKKPTPRERKVSVVMASMAMTEDRFNWNENAQTSDLVLVGCWRINWEEIIL